MVEEDDDEERHRPDGGGGGRGRGRGRGRHRNRGGRGDRGRSGGRSGRGNRAAANSNSNDPEEEIERQDQGDDSRNKRNNKKERRRNDGRNRQSNNNRDRDSRADGAPPAPDVVPPYLPHLSLEECHERYAAGDPTLARGTLRVLPSGGGGGGGGSGSSFVTCDRGWHAADICVPGPRERNRALHGDRVFVELLPPANEEEESEEEDQEDEDVERDTRERLDNLQLNEEGDGDAVDVEEEEEEGAGDVVNEEYAEEEVATWQDDPAQVDLWNPIVPGIRKPSAKRSSAASAAAAGAGNNTAGSTRRGRSTACRFPEQRLGRVVQVLPPQAVRSELDAGGKGKVPTRPLVGTLKVLQSGTVLLTPNSKSLPQFRCPSGTDTDAMVKEARDNGSLLFRAEYAPGSWRPDHKWPPCRNVTALGEAFVIENEILALLIENNVTQTDEFSPDVSQCVHRAVESGLYRDDRHKEQEQEWKPTPDMYRGRRDYRHSRRIFTIDPTTAKDLDDALHIRQLPDNTIEVGVHIADVSYFVTPGSPVDLEAQFRTTTIYLVDRTIPMLPRPLCEIACSLNENVDRLAFSCVWRMNPDGTLCRKKKSAVKGGGGSNDEEDVWYGRTVIRSCARLDYATAQNIIDGEVATGEGEAEMDEALWPSSRRPGSSAKAGNDGQQQHTVDQVAADVRLMHRVAMARRKLRFDNGALALHGIKLTFQLDDDGQTPLLAQPYPIRDSNRLVEEYMLLANYLVAQRLITHAKDLAVLRLHPDPQMEGLDKVVDLAKAAMNFDIDPSSSQTLHKSLIRLSHEAASDDLLLQCVTNLIMTPMKAAEYFVAGLEEKPEEWRHYALNIPYYTHFTSPIRRYPDVLVHRLLQATLDGPQALQRFPFEQATLGVLCDVCNEKRMGSKAAQERCDRVFLSLYVQQHPLTRVLGVVLSVGKMSFTVYVPSLGASTLLNLQDHTDILTYAAEEKPGGARRILLQEKPPNQQSKNGQQQQQQQQQQQRWNTLEIEIFVKLSVTVLCQDKPPVDIRLRLEGPWRPESR